MEPVISRLSLLGVKGGALGMLTAALAYAISRDPIALLIFPMLISLVQLACLVEGPWTPLLMRRLPVLVATEAAARH